MLVDELREQLMRLCATTGALDAYIARGDEAEDGVFRAPLGGGAFLELRLPGGRAPRDAESAAIERAVRAIRAAGRRWNEPLPLVGGAPELPMRQRIIGRIERFLDALITDEGAVNALVTVRGQLVASARPLEELQRERIDFMLRRVDAEVARKVGTSSHAELGGDDFYAASFWYGACLIVFFDGEFSVDFVRHRARMVTRELAELLPDLDDPPRDPARVAPVPE